MVRKKTIYICQSCGSVHPKWAGRCEDCNQWNTIIEEIEEKKAGSSKASPLPFHDLQGQVTDYSRIDTNIGELNQVLGGGLVPGSVILLGGDPGIGKSTLLLQLVSKLSLESIPTIYVSGEESIDQIRLRARRLEVSENSIKLLSCTNLDEILASLETQKQTKLVIIDSIQTIYTDELNAAPGTVSQVRSCAQKLIDYAKQRNVCLLMIGHVTKEGTIAGPKILEHMVDAVLYFEGEKDSNFRILRSVKNRYGSVNEIGIFEMRDKGLAEIANPSHLFLTDRPNNVSGSVVFAAIEGSRPVLVEIQALIAPSNMITPRRSVVGWDINRLAMIVAVLGVRYGIALADKEIYLNVVGGMRILEPAADLAVAAALVSAAINKPLEKNTIIFGEVGLSGEIRKVTSSSVRLKEAEKLGFERAIVPFGTIESSIDKEELAHIKQLKGIFK
jgi:DNA repair protein RadA/Sms